MIQNTILGRTVRKRGDIGVIPVGQNPDRGLAHNIRQQVGRPESVCIGRGPGAMRMAVESMDEDDINDRVWRLVDDVQAELPNARCDVHRRRARQWPGNGVVYLRECIDG